MAHYLFNLSETEAGQVPALREQAAARLRVNMWGVDADEPHRDGLAPGDLILIYLAEPERAFVGHAELVSAFVNGHRPRHRRTPAVRRAECCSPGSRNGIRRC